MTLLIANEAPSDIQRATTTTTTTKVQLQLTSNVQTAYKMVTFSI